MSGVADIGVLADVHDGNDVHVLWRQTQHLGKNLVEFLLLGFLAALLDDELLRRCAWDGEKRTMQLSYLRIIHN